MANGNSTHAWVVSSVAMSTVLLVASAAPSGTELVPYVPVCAYSFATIVPVGLPDFAR